MKDPGAFERVRPRVSAKGMFRRLLPALAGIVVAGAASGAERSPEPARDVDLGRYLGTWYEIARLPNGFERGCQAATAEYSRRGAGGIRVVNTCYVAGVPARRAVGRARVVDAAGAKLKVSFFGPFWSDYWILDRADDYSWALVGDGERKLFWVLARDPRPEGLDRIVSRAEELGYRRERLEWSDPAALGPGTSP